MRTRRRGSSTPVQRARCAPTLLAILTGPALPFSLAQCTADPHQIENALKELSFEKLVVYRPSVLDRGVDTRFVEKVSVPFMNLFNKYQVMPVSKLAGVMIEHAVTPPAEAATILENPAIHNAA